MALLLYLATIVSKGKAAVLVTIPQKLTTRQAAQMLGMSHKKLLALLDAGDIACEPRNAYRVIDLDEIFRYSELQKGQK
jgi:hypothetical protein